MLNSKERSFLRGQANNIEDIIHIGKDGLTENIIKQAYDALKKRELIKGKIQNNSLEDVREIGEKIAKMTNAELVCTIGNKFILYKKNKDKNQYGI